MLPNPRTNTPTNGYLFLNILVPSFGNSANFNILGPYWCLIFVIFGPNILKLIEMVQKYPSRSPNYGPNIHNLNILVPYLCHLFGPNIFKFTEFHIPNSGDVSDGFKFRSEILVISRTFLRSQFWVMAVPVEARSTDKAIPCQSRGHTLAKFCQSQGNPCIIPKYSIGTP